MTKPVPQDMQNVINDNLTALSEFTATVHGHIIQV